jgi:hypothetical protein
LNKDPGLDELSEAETEAADEAFKEYDGLGCKEAAAHAHQLYKEWENPGGTSYPIAIANILSAGGQTGHEYIDEVNLHCRLNELVGR